MLAKTFLAVAVLGFLGATTAWPTAVIAAAAAAMRTATATTGTRRPSSPPASSTSSRWCATSRSIARASSAGTRSSVSPYVPSVWLATAAGSIVGAAIGRQFGSGNDRDTLTVLGAVAGGAVAHRRAVRQPGLATRDVTVQRCEVVNDRVTEEIVDGYS